MSWLLIEILWLPITAVSYGLLLCYCDWFLFLSRRHEYVVLAPLALVWPLTAVIAVCVTIYGILKTNSEQPRRRAR